MYTDISTVVFSHIVLNDGQWSVGFVLDSNDLTSTDDYQQRVLKRLTEVRREWLKQGEKQNLKQKDKEFQSIIQSLQDELKQTKDQYNQKLKKDQQDIERLRQELQESQQQLQESQQQLQESQQ